MPRLSDSAQRIPAYCPLCISTCGCLATVEDGRLIRIDPDPGHPTGVALCGKGRASVDFIGADQRLSHPLRRTRPKEDADAGWEPVGWEEALDDIAGRMRTIADQSGPEAVTLGCSTPSGTALSDAFGWIDRFAFAFGTPNFLAASTEICNWHRDDAYAFTWGTSQPAPDIANAGCLLLWGHNPRAAWLSRMTRALDSVKGGAALIVVDPRQEGLASRADVWLRVRPGADAALALALAGELIRGDHYDEAFLRTWSTGPALVRSDTRRMLRMGDIDASRSRDLAGIGRDLRVTALQPGLGAFALEACAEIVLADGTEVPCETAFSLWSRRARDWTPERAAETAWVDPGAVRAAAELLSNRSPVAHATWTGVGQGTNATQTARTIATLYALTGDWDAPGGNVQFPGVPVEAPYAIHTLPPAQLVKALGRAERPLGPAAAGAIGARQLWRSIIAAEPYRTRALIAFGINPVMTQADPLEARDALRRLDLHVQIDQVLTPTAAFADYVLPAGSPWERESVHADFKVDAEASRTVQWRPALITPRGQARSDLEIVCGLAERLGLSRTLGGRTPRELHDRMLAAAGLSVKTLQDTPGHRVVVDAPTVYRKYAQPDHHGRPTGFSTPSGRVELYIEAFLDVEEDPVPAFVEPLVSPARLGAQAAAFPLVLTSAKLPQFCHSQHRGIGKLRRAVRDPGVSMHSDAAAVRGLSAGDWAQIRSPLGQIRARVTLDDSLDVRVAVGQFGWWEPCAEIDAPGYPALAEDGSSANFGLLVGGDALDPISGSQPLRQYVCQIEALKSKDIADAKRDRTA